MTGEQKTEEGYDLEIFNIVMEKGSNDWDEIKREAYQEGIIDFDRSGRVASFIEEALFYSEERKKEKVAELIFAIAWHGWVYTPFRNREVKGYRWLLTEELWFLRGDEKNAYYTARYCVDLLLELMFAMNSKWTPDYKWRYIRSKKLPWLPEHYLESMDALLFGAWSSSTWEDQRSRLQLLVDETVSHAAEFLPDDWYAII